jgi:hypothetical protein
MFDPQAAVIGDLQPESAVIYGVAAAVGAGPESEIRRARVSAGGPVVTDVKPSGGEVKSLDEVVITFDREVDPRRVERLRDRR